ncbi:MAG: DUF3105 domain-containing protein [Chloroflexi bacterium]|jgi:hypothetical protein|nr:DUF3105 domain-containing protein [Chloroflexota bacterium]MBT4072787.1 DUF3105 domain-containing protein [Chloroflexota bacterium]MBT4514371.1 DUF3105 domain-containing protein [Chloroflexota bacterium]MBT5320034.1 DUF3105 domain-containing protein [Chloroflexota bacterium]
MPDRIASTRPENRRGMSRGERRAERRGKSDARKRRKRYIYTGIAGAIALLFIGSLLVPGGSGRQTSDNNNLNTGGPLEIMDDQGRSHVTPGEPAGPFLTQPAASGPHWITNPSDIVPTGSPARWGAYAAPLPDEVQIHNLEHGGIILNYNCSEGCAELVDQLQSLIPGQGAQFILAPYPNMESRIAITSWRHQDKMDEFDADRLNEFIDAYLDRAPESVQGNLF